MFSTTKKGYSKDEVDAYIKKSKNEYELQLAEQKERIFELKKSLTDCEKKLAEAKSRDGLISKALLGAVQKAEEIERVSQQKYNLEVEQLRAFHYRWLKYYEQLLKKYPLNKELISLAHTNEQISKVLQDPKPQELDKISFAPSSPAKTRGEAEEMYEDERVRLRGGGANIEAISKAMEDTNNEADERMESMFRKIAGRLKKEEPAKSFDPMTNIKDYLDASPSDSGFSYEEAQNPKDSLEDIMRDLGLLED